MKKQAAFLLMALLSAFPLAGEDEGGNFARFDFEKNINTFFFNNTAFYKLNTGFGNFGIRQFYKGTSFTTGSKVFRDDEKFNLLYDYSIDDDFSIVARQNWIYNSNSRSAGINRLNRINFLGGIAYTGESIMAEFTAGGEQNDQAGFESPAAIYKINSILSNFSPGGYDIFGNFESEILDLDRGRTNSEYRLDAGFNKIYGGSDEFTGGLNYLRLGRDFLVPDQNEFFNNENRLENRIGLDLSAGLNIIGNFSGEAAISFSNVLVNRSFRNYDSINSSTGVEKKLDEFNLDLSSSVAWRGKSFSISAGFEYALRNEQNILENKHQIAENEFNRLKTLDFQRDNNSSRTRINGNLALNTGRWDTLKSVFSLGILRYDTPSGQNNDDRDELNTIWNISFTKKVSSLLRWNVSLDLQSTHFVFLKAEKSSLNNMNRIIGLGQQIIYQTKSFAMRPKIHVLANYTVYDFEEIAPGARSYSFRQITFADSLKVQVSKSFEIKGNLFARYFERGILYWDEFAESPQSGNLEYYARMLMGLNSENPAYYAGVRFYRLEQTNLSLLKPAVSFGHFSFGPEIGIEYVMKNSTLEISGWYEFQDINGAHREVPNLKMTTNLHF